MHYITVQSITHFTQTMAQHTCTLAIQTEYNQTENWVSFQMMIPLGGFIFTLIYVTDLLILHEISGT